jgi:hypothetical protein
VLIITSYDGRQTAVWRLPTGSHWPGRHRFIALGLISRVHSMSGVAAFLLYGREVERWPGVSAHKGAAPVAETSCKPADAHDSAK